MASSTTMPIASTIANSVDRWTVNVSAAMPANAPMMVTGTVVMGTSMARQSCRNTRITISTRIAASNSVFTHFVDGLAHERGGIERNGIGQPGRKSLRGLAHLLGDFAGHVERVRLQRLVDADAGCRLAVEGEDLAIGLRAELYAADVAHVDHLPVLRGLDHDVFELADVVEAAGDVERILEGLRARGRRHAELAGRDLLVLAFESVDDIFGRQREGIELVGVEPDAHRILAGPEDIDLAHARQARELRLQRDGRVIGKEKAVVAIVRRG